MLPAFAFWMHDQQISSFPTFLSSSHIPVVSCCLVPRVHPEASCDGPASFLSRHVMEKDVHPFMLMVCLSTSCPHSSLGRIPFTIHCLVSTFILNKCYAAFKS